MTDDPALPTAWTRSSHSGTEANNCLEWRRDGGRRVAVRDSKNPRHGTLTLSTTAWQTFVSHAPSIPAPHPR
ncbi:DUF397 domain-containing protein [Streptomyces sp. ACA25]|uniref:DUF397 domain-containing protein n=1 Tax=Streptomyces sp. ACA25 TaxID=3022596 RepID=UPI002307A900|nr:DUF397 domain-containing protein [Streptomyces sp. ACA25]MDB1086734.1 DUF397 domain-containing protein [Streptomyces sp. ACA25]